MLDTLQKASLKPVADTINKIPVKHIIDTIKVQTGDSLELISKVDTFYNNAWDKLVITLSIIGGIVAFVIPYITNWYQQKTFKVNQERLNENFTKEIKRVELEITTLYNERFEKLEERLNAKIASRANHLQASIEKLSNNVPMSAYLYLLSVNGMLKLGEDNSHKIVSTLENVLATLKIIDIRQFYKNANSGRVTYDDIISDMRANTIRFEVINLINQIDELVRAHSI